jgi:hypothetical protein
VHRTESGPRKSERRAGKTAIGNEIKAKSLIRRSHARHGTTVVEEKWSGAESCRTKPAVKKFMEKIAIAESKTSAHKPREQKAEKS